MRALIAALILAITGTLVVVLVKPALATQAVDARLVAIRDLAERRYGGEAPGGAVMVIEDGAMLMAEGFGLANLEWDQPADAGTAFRIGSITKVITAIAILRLAEDGRLDLDAPVSAYLPDLPGELGRPTLHQLLSHTSGLGDHFALPQIPEIMRNPITPDGIIALMADQSLQSEPGTRHAYSNFGYVLLGRVIEAVDPQGRDYGTHIEEEIFAPLGMENSHYDRQSAIIPHRAAGYDLGPDGPVNTITFETSLAHAAGALLTSAHDMAIFTRALTGGELLSNSLRDEAWTPVLLSDGTDTQYGLGFNASDFMGEALIWHSGSINGFQATWAYQPGTGRSVAVFSNGYYRANTTDTARRILAILDGRPAPEFTAQAINETEWQGAEGRYQLEDGRRLQIQIDDGIRFNLDGGRWRELAWAGSETAFSPDTLRHFIFDRGPDGNITGVSYVSTTLERQHGLRLDGAIEGARSSIPLDANEAEAITGNWGLASGDVVTISQAEERLFLALPYQPPQRIIREAPLSYFSRENPIGIRFHEDGDTATLTLWGNEMIVTRQ